MPDYDWVSGTICQDGYQRVDRCGVQGVKMDITGAQIIIECLVEQGVNTVFGYPGGTVLPLYDALYLNKSRIRHILTAHVSDLS